MNHISIELVPRAEHSLHKELQIVSGAFKRVTMVNIPDIVRFELRSWQAAAIAKQYYSNCVPHIRACDFDTEKKILSLLHFLDIHHITNVLVVSGDTDSNGRSSNTSVELIAKLKQQSPILTVYAGVDPYRSSIRIEKEYSMRKREAGADGFFTQPFFDMRLLEIYHHVLQADTIFWGLSPVVTASNARYWEKKNNVVFPKNFKPTLSWNRAFAQRVIKFINRYGGNLYFMPIKVDIAEYLKGIL